MSASKAMEWDCFVFVSHISGWSVQAIIINKMKRLIRLEGGGVDYEKRSSFKGNDGAGTGCKVE